MHDCIIIPKFGGFVLQTISTSYDKAENLFSPTRKEVVFNVTLQHNDGLLLESYMRKYEVDHRKAQLMLDEDIEAFKSLLQEEKEVALGIVGSFSLGEEGQVVFYPNKIQTFGVESYGLPAFHFPTLDIHEAEEEGAKDPIDRNQTAEPTVRRSVHGGFLRVVATSAAAVALFLLVSTPVKDVSQTAYTASFIPTEMVINRVAPVEYAPVEKEIVEDAETPDADKPKTVVPETVKEKKAVVEKEIEKREALKSAKTFHIVIASFPTEAQANEFLASVDRRVCRNANKVKSNGKYRVYADKYNNRTDAESYLSKLRNNPAYKDAWLFITR